MPPPLPQPQSLPAQQRHPDPQARAGQATLSGLRPSKEGTASQPRHVPGPRPPPVPPHMPKAQSLPAQQRPAEGPQAGAGQATPSKLQPSKKVMTPQEASPQPAQEAKAQPAHVVPAPSGQQPIGSVSSQPGPLKAAEQQVAPEAAGPSKIVPAKESSRLPAPAHAEVSASNPRATALQTGLPMAVQGAASHGQSRPLELPPVQAGPPSAQAGSVQAAIAGPSTAEPGLPTNARPPQATVLQPPPASPSAGMPESPQQKPLAQAAPVKKPQAGSGAPAVQAPAAEPRPITRLKLQQGYSQEASLPASAIKVSAAKVSTVQPVPCKPQPAASNTQFQQAAQPAPAQKAPAGPKKASWPSPAKRKPPSRKGLLLASANVPAGQTVPPQPAATQHASTPPFSNSAGQALVHEPGPVISRTPSQDTSQSSEPKQPPVKRKPLKSAPEQAPTSKPSQTSVRQTVPPVSRPPLHPVPAQDALQQRTQDRPAQSSGPNQVSRSHPNTAVQVRQSAPCHNAENLSYYNPQQAGQRTVSGGALNVRPPRTSRRDPPRQQSPPKKRVLTISEPPKAGPSSHGELSQLQGPPQKRILTIAKPPKAAPNKQQPSTTEAAKQATPSQQAQGSVPLPNDIIDVQSLLTPVQETLPPTLPLEMPDTSAPPFMATQPSHTNIQGLSLLQAGCQILEHACAAFGSDLLEMHANT